MTDIEIELFRIAVTQKLIFWRSVDGDVMKVIGFHPNYREPSDDIGEPVAVLTNGRTVALLNSEVEDFVEFQPLVLGQEP